MILQKHLPLTPWMEERGRRLPGLAPVALADWLLRDEVYAQQMALRDQLLCHSRDQVYQRLKDAGPGGEELLRCLVAELPQQEGYEISGDIMRRPDGMAIELYKEDPLIVAGRLVQEDLIILEQRTVATPVPGARPGTWRGVPSCQYLLGQAIVCFPASWTLAEKIGRPMVTIHQPVMTYSDDIARRVDRVLDNLRPEQPLMRANFLVYTDPSLFQPRQQGEEKPLDPNLPRYVRVERQTLRRLPQTGAIVFAIHTFVVTPETLSRDETARLAQLRPELCADA